MPADSFAVGRKRGRIARKGKRDPCHGPDGGPALKFSAFENAYEKGTAAENRAAVRGKRVGEDNQRTRLGAV